MDRLRQKLASKQTRRKSKRRRGQTEVLEERVYLSVSSLFSDGEIQIVADAEDDITLGVDPNSPGSVQLTVNGAIDTSLGSIQASIVQAITIVGSDSDNVIDISGVTSADFTFVDPNTSLGVQVLVAGDDGNDTIIGSLDLDVTLNGGNGADSINQNLSLTPTGNLTIDAGDGDDAVSGGTGNDNIDAGDGNDVVLGGDGNDTITGNNGNDILNGDAGDDSVFGDDGADTISGGDGTDMVNGGSGTDSVSGDAGNDTVYGGAGTDMLFGDGGASPGDDVVYGNSGDDQINGGGGNDLLDGGTGDDLIVTVQSQFAILETNVNVAEGAAGGGTVANFTITLSSSLPTATSVQVSTVDDTAIAGLDYLAVNQTLTFNPGITTLQVSVPLIGDDIGEPTEMFSLMLSNPVGAQLGAATATATILDDDIITPPPAAGPFDIVVSFSGGLTASQMAIFSVAEARIEAIITGDVPDVTLPGGVLVDDLVIDASGVPIDGAGGVLGQAGPNMLRPVSNLPITGTMRFDTADLAALEASGELTQVILHEMLHVIGIGTIWQLTGNLTGAGTADPQFTGANATAEYNSIFSNTDPSVPVENTGGPGTADGHFRETVFDNELMTGFLNAGRPNPLSRITIGSLADIGYQVDLTQADAYPAGLRSSINETTSTEGMILAMRGEQSMVIPDEWLRIGEDPDVPTASIEPQTPVSGDLNVVTTVTFDEVPMQPVDGLTVGEVTYGFTVNGAASTDANYASFGPNLVNFLQDPVLEGTASGILSLDFSTPVDSIQFGLARSIQAPVTNGVEVRLFDTAGNPAGTFPLDLITPVSFGEVQFTYTGLPVQRMEVDLTVASAAQGGTRFAVDNLIYNTAMAVATPSATVIGGTGNDTLIASNGDDILNGGGGNDIIDGGIGNDTILGGGGADSLFGSDGNDRIRGQGGMDSIEGGNGDDSIDGGSSRDTIYGDDSLGNAIGNDTISGGADNDSLFGGAGNDSILGGGGRDSLSGDAGDDTLDGQGGDDTLDGGDGDDTIDWDGDNDGNDTVVPGDGGDTITVTGTGAADTFNVSQNGSDLVISRGTSSLSVPTTGLAAGIETVVLNAGNGADTITIGNLDQVGAAILLVNGEDGNDTISALGAAIGRVRLQIDGGDGDDTLTGSDDADTILGGAGLDVITGNNGDDTLLGGDDADMIAGSNGNDVIDGNNGNDTALGESGDDSISGSFGDDMLVGDIGNDTIDGGFGDDLLNGMSGNDSLLGNFGNDRIAAGSGDDTVSGGNDNDTIQGHSGADLIDGDHGDDLIIGQAGNDTIFGDDGNDTIMGGSGNDVLYGEDGDDLIDGEGASDTIVGGDGNDTLRGGGSDDTILGQDGDDVINGNSGNDTASEGEGADTVSNVETIDKNFVLSSDLIRDFDTLARK